MFGKPDPQNMKQVVCYGAPPTPVALPHPQGIQFSSMRPHLLRTELACAVHKHGSSVLLLGPQAGSA